MIGILCGLKSEALIADRIPGVVVGCSAAQPERAQAMAYHMIDQGVERLISFGLAGATSPDLRAGDLVLGATVMAAGGQAWEADPEWNDRLMQRLDCMMFVPIWGSKHIVTSVEEKDAIFRRAGCLSVDMESHVAAQVAARYRIPFNVVRAVADTASMAMPPAARVPLLEDGSVDKKGVMRSILNAPSQMFSLIRLGRNTSAAMHALERAVSVMAEIENEKGV